MVLRDKIVILLWLVSITTIGPAGCCVGVQCEPCLEPGITINVYDEVTRDRLGGFYITIIKDGSITIMEEQLIEDPFLILPDAEAGHYTITISKFGYINKEVEGTVSKHDCKPSDCCCCEEEGITYSIYLEPEV